MIITPQNIITAGAVLAALLAIFGYYNKGYKRYLKMLEQDGTIRHKYDYTWIMVAINDGAINGLGSFRSPQRFMDYLKELGVEHVPSRTTLSTCFNKVIGSYPNWEFIDTQDPQEILRRKNIINQLISALNKAKIKEPEQKAEQ